MWNIGMIFVTNFPVEYFANKEDIFSFDFVKFFNLCINLLCMNYISSYIIYSYIKSLNDNDNNKNKINISLSLSNPQRSKYYIYLLANSIYL